MEAMKETVMYKGNDILLPFFPGIYYDADLFIRDGKFVVSVQPPPDVDEPMEATYDSVSDMLYDWVFASQCEPLCHEWDAQDEQDFTHYRWTEFTKKLIEAYSKAMMAATKAKAKCEPITCGNEQTYLYRSLEILRSIRKPLTKVTIKPKD